MQDKDNYTNKKFGKLTVIKITNKRAKNRGVICECACDCGNIIEVPLSNLKSGNTKSCGCIKCKHGMNRRNIYNKIYKTWIDMKSRCYNKNVKSYKDYGARKISVCEEWKNDFMKFYNWAMKNGYKDNLSIDRINVNGNYEPSNCRWANKKIQANNTTRNHFITFNGVTLTLQQWSEKTGIKSSTIRARLKRGWSIKECLTK